MPRLNRILLAIGIPLASLLCSANGTYPSSARHFVEAGLALDEGERERLAAKFDARQLPLILASFSANPPDDIDPARLYSALAGWHYFAGKHFDPRQRGVWTTGESAFSAGDHSPANLTLSSGAALELVELAALARLADQRDYIFDPIVWWHDHLDLRVRLTNAFYDPVDGAYAHLDSLGRRLTEPALSGLIPVALGARHGSEATRRAAWKLWTGSEQRIEQGDLQTGLQARQAAAAFAAASGDHGLHVATEAVMAALSLQALDDLDEPELSVYARDALAARGLPTGRDVEIVLGSSTLPLSTEWIALQPLERSRAAIRFYKGVGVFAPARADSLLALTRLPEDATDSTIAASVAKITDLLVELSAVDVRKTSNQWLIRRAGRNDLNETDEAAFELQWTDLRIWFDHGLELLTADILAWHLRSDPASKWTATLNPHVIGEGDQPHLLVHCRSGQEASDYEPDSLTLMWTDGTSLLPPQEFQLTQTSPRDFESAVPTLPTKIGLWQLIVEGLPKRPRLSAAISVVDPVVVSIVPTGRRASTVDWAVQLRSQVRSPINGRINLQTPLSWTGAPGTSLQYSLEPGEASELHFAVTPDFDVAPGSYPLRWTAWSNTQLIGEYETQVDRPFAWLRIGPLPITDPDKPINSPYAFDRRIDLAQRLQGLESTVAWTKLPGGRVDPEGFIVLESAGNQPGLHYAFTGFVTQSEDAVLELASDGPARLFVNGRRVVNLERWGGRREAEVRFGSGTNFVVVKLADLDGSGARFRLRVRDIDGSELRAVGNKLEHLLENYAYLARARQGEPGSVQRQTLRLVPIRYLDPQADTVSVVGSFNGWSPASTPMTRLENGSWQVKIRLRPGRFEYKFAVDVSDWIPDPNNPAAVADGFGGRNSVLIID